VKAIANTTACSEHGHLDDLRDLEDLLTIAGIARKIVPLALDVVVPGPPIH
jgi:hypothetical protein